MKTMLLVALVLLAGCAGAPPVTGTAADPEYILMKRKDVGGLVRLGESAFRQLAPARDRTCLATPAAEDCIQWRITKGTLESTDKTLWDQIFTFPKAPGTTQDLSGLGEFLKLIPMLLPLIPL